MSFKDLGEDTLVVVNDISVPRLLHRKCVTIVSDIQSREGYDPVNNAALAKLVVWSESFSNDQIDKIFDSSPDLNTRALTILVSLAKEVLRDWIEKSKSKPLDSRAHQHRQSLIEIMHHAKRLLYASGEENMELKVEGVPKDAGSVLVYHVGCLNVLLPGMKQRLRSLT